MKNWMFKGALIAGLGLVMVGCGDDSLSEEDSQKGFAATQSALTMGASGAQSSGGALQTIDSFEFSCPEGGTAVYNGQYDQDDASGQTTFSYSVAFKGCVSQGVTISGTMNYDFDVTASGTSGDYDLKYVYQGDVDFSGGVEGNCEIDVNMALSGGANGGSFSYSGSICGNDAGDVAGSYSANGVSY